MHQRSASAFFYLTNIRAKVSSSFSKKSMSYTIMCVCACMRDRVISLICTSSKRRSSSVKESEREIREVVMRGVSGNGANKEGAASFPGNGANEEMNTYSRAWRRRQVWWHRSERGSGASRRRRTQRGPSASSRAVGEPRRPVGILVPPIAPAGTPSRP